MTTDELIRAISYFLMFPAFAFFGMIEWNRGQRVVSLLYGFLSIFFFLLMVGLVLLRYYRPLPELLQANTVVVLALASITSYRASLLLLAAIRERVQDNWRVIGEKHG